MLIFGLKISRLRQTLLMTLQINQHRPTDCRAELSRKFLFIRRKWKSGNRWFVGRGTILRLKGSKAYGKQ